MEVAIVAKPGQRVLEGELVQVVGIAPEVFLGLLAGGDVLDLPDEVDRLAGGIANDGHAQKPPDDRPVGPEITLLELEALDLPVENARHELEIGVEVVGMGHSLKAELGQLLLGAADEYAESPVGGQEGSVEGDERHSDGERS